MHFRWECNACGGEHTHDFAERMTCVKREKRAPDSLKRPDISLYREDDLCCLIEVVVTHPPEQPVRDYARERRVTLVVVNMKKDPDLDGTIKAEVLEGSVCPNMPPGAPPATLSEVKEHLRVNFDLMAEKYEADAELLDIPGLPGFPGIVDSPVILREGQYAVGVFKRVKWPFTEGAGRGAHVYLRHLTDKRFVLPVVVSSTCEDLRNEALLGRVVLVSCTFLSEVVGYRNDKPFRKWLYRITPLEVNPDTGEILKASE